MNTVSVNLKPRRSLVQTLFPGLFEGERAKYLLFELWRSFLPVSARKAVIQSPVDNLPYQWVTQGPLVLVRRIFVLLCIMKIEGGLKEGQRRFTLEFGLRFFENFQAIFYYEFCCL